MLQETSSSHPEQQTSSVAPEERTSLARIREYLESPLATPNVLRRLIVVRLQPDDNSGLQRPEIVYACSDFDGRRAQLEAATLHHAGGATLDMPVQSFAKITPAALLTYLAEHPAVQKRMQRWPGEPLMVVEPSKDPRNSRLKLLRPRF